MAGVTKNGNSSFHIRLGDMFSVSTPWFQGSNNSLGQVTRIYSGPVSQKFQDVFRKWSLKWTMLLKNEHSSFDTLLGDMILVSTPWFQWSCKSFGTRYKDMQWSIMSKKSKLASKIA